MIRPSLWPKILGGQGPQAGPLLASEQTLGDGGPWVTWGEGRRRTSQPGEWRAQPLQPCPIPRPGRSQA